MLRELIMDHVGPPEFLRTIPTTVQHFAFEPTLYMALWSTDDMAKWIANQKGFKVLSLTGPRAEDIRKMVHADADERSAEEAQMCKAYRDWKRACDLRGAELVLYDEDWPWVST